MPILIAVTQQFIQVEQQLSTKKLIKNKKNGLAIAKPFFVSCCLINCKSKFFKQKHEKKAETLPL